MHTLVVVRQAHKRSQFAVREDKTGTIVFKSYKRSEAQAEQAKRNAA